VAGAKLFKVLVKIPLPAPSNVLLSEIVGFADVLQHIPLEVILAPPVEVMEPPDIAEDEVIDEITDVVSVAGTETVVKVSSFP
jgi:hypothetical protein